MRFLGFVPAADLPGLYREADVFATASEAELQSLVTMEAMAAGLPVVAADACALGELVSHGRNGFLAAPGRADQMAASLDLLAADPGLRARMGAASRRAIGGHERRRTLAEWESLYGLLAGARPGGPGPVTRTGPRAPVPLLFLIGDTGGGHRSAAEAVAQALDQAYPGRFAPVICDPLRGPGSPLRLRWLVSLYGPCIRLTPWLWGLLWRSCGSPRDPRLGPPDPARPGQPQRRPGGGRDLSRRDRGFPRVHRGARGARPGPAPRRGSP